AKKGVDANAAARFRAEVHGLRLLAESGAVRTPAVVGIVELDAPAGGAILVLEAIHTREASQADWQELGRSLAALHRPSKPYFGLAADNYLGFYGQDNRAAPDWTTFYAERRLRPMLRATVDEGKLEKRDASSIER